MKLKDFLEHLDQQRVIDAIHYAETQTSGEIRVHVQAVTHGHEIRTLAERTFERLGMTKTAERSGVLLLVASEEQKFVILGDQGINDRVPAGFWDDIATKLTIRFRKGEYTDGIVEAIRSAGEQLRHFFPRTSTDVNELTNDISVDH